MNEPIISPWIIYVISTFTGIRILFTLIAIICGIISVNSWVDSSDEFAGEKTRKHHRKIATRFLIAFFCSILAIVLIPSKETAYEMLAARFITPSNIEKGTEVIKSSADYLADTIIRIQKGGEEK